MTDAEAYYLPLGDGTFETTSATASPWDASLQHGGPPAGLLARAVEHVRPDDDMQLARMTVDMLGGIPQGRMRTEASIVRPGRRIEMIQASLWAGDQLAVTATAWRIRRTPSSTEHLVATSAVPPVPAEQTQHFFEGLPDDWGYGRSIDWRFVEGGFNELGPAKVWTRLRIPVVAGEEPSGVQRMLVVADSANGLSGELPLHEWYFIPPTATTTIQRPPPGQWVLLDAASSTGPSGVGLAQGRLSDEGGLLGVVAQPLLVVRR